MPPINPMSTTSTWEHNEHIEHSEHGDYFDDPHRRWVCEGYKSPILLTQNLGCLFPTLLKDGIVQYFL